MILFLYKNILRGTTPLLERLLKKRLAAGKEDGARSHERRGAPVKARGDQPLIWFHAASVGESVALLALVTRLRQLYPQWQVMVTTGTVTSAKLMAERLPNGAFHQYIPVDSPLWVEGFLTHWRPNLVIWSESDFWPNMLMAIQRRAIPAVLLNARMSEKSFRRWQWAKGTIRTLLQTFDLCLAQNSGEAARLEKLGARNVKIAGNLKYAAEPLPYDARQLEILNTAIGDRPHLLWASTHVGEEIIAARVHRALKEKYPRLLTIIVPRHPQRGAAIAAEMGSGAKLRSLGQLPDEMDQIYIADTLGELGLFYRAAKQCIVGGSFVPVGGHNPIEPARFGCQIFYGSYMFNFLTIAEDFALQQAACPVADETQLIEKLDQALQGAGDFSGMALRGKNWTEQQSLVVEAILAGLTPFLHSIGQEKTC